MRKGNRLFLLVMFVWIVVLLPASGCSLQGKEAEKPLEHSGGTSDGVLIGVSVLDLANPYYVQLVNGIKKEAQLRNAGLIIDDPKSDVNRQIQAVEKFIDLKLDAIIIAALDQNALEGVLGKAMEAGIKVVAQATKVENCDTYVSFDEWDMGHTIGQGAGKWIRDRMDGKAEVVILNYPRIAQIVKREKGIRDGIAEFAPDAEIVAVASSADPIEGKRVTGEILKKHPNVKVVVGINDGGALGALEAFEEVGKAAGDVFIGGIDATPEAVEQIKRDSVYRATVDINPYYSGMLNVDFAIKLIKGQIVPNQYSENARLVTRENIGSY